ncbi:hypothetical protein ANN_00468 [Periplaneta americana]|uniref:UDP-glucuronosyltransferase n=1 Tax=Periplaneta americana TaxID=6978 RepID=A0ABQ8TT94_PERAM|nr:hypothetical protein ANN_00468 [Periplaneta americana]
MDLREVGYDDRDWINLAQERDRWRAYVRAAMNLRVNFHFILGIFFALFCVDKSENANILAMTYFSTRSHFNMFEVLLKALAARGHQVSVVGCFTQTQPIANYTDISIVESLPNVTNYLQAEFMLRFRFIGTLWKMYQDLSGNCQKILEHPNLQKLIKGDQKFDVIITPFMGPECYLGFPYHFNAPLIGLITSVAHNWWDDGIGNPINPAYIPNIGTPFTQNMNFWDRLVNTLWYVATKFGQYFFSEIRMDKLMKEVFGPDIPPLSQLRNYASLVLVNSHFSLNYPRPAVPAFVEVGGIHIQGGEKLPKELETYLNNAEHGAILFSFGSIVKGEMGKDQLQAFIDAFSTLPQRVLWKIDRIPGLPTNIVTSKWLPQFAILCHPKVRAFITHGGMLGTQEAVYCGVPMVGIPFGLDQMYNVRNCVEKGVAVELDYYSITNETIIAALNAVINDSRVLVGRPEGKRPLERTRRRWEDNIKMDLREVGYDDRDWIDLAQDRDLWRAYVRAAMNLRVP